MVWGFVCVCLVRGFCREGVGVFEYVCVFIGSVVECWGLVVLGV